MLCASCVCRWSCVCKLPFPRFIGQWECPCERRRKGQNGKKRGRKGASKGACKWCGKYAVLVGELGVCERCVEWGLSRVSPGSPAPGPEHSREETE